MKKRISSLFLSMTVLLTAVISSSSNLLMAQWIQTSGPEGGEAKCLTAIDTTLFVGTEIGVFRSTNDGTTWTPTGLENTIVVSLAVSPTGGSGMNLFAGTVGGGVSLSTDNGTSWNPVNFGLSNRYVAALAVSGTNLFAGTEGGVFLSPSNGDYWIPVSTGLTNTSINCLTVIGANLYAGTDSGLYISTNNGTTWNPAGLTGETVNALAAMDTFLFAGTAGNGVFRSPDNGAYWEIVSNPDMDRYVSTLAVINTNLFVGTNRGLYLTPNYGAYWIPVNTGLTNTSVEALYVRGTDLFAGTYGGVFRSTNNGTNWTEVNTGLKTTVVYALAASGESLYAGTRGGMYRSNDRGDSWISLGANAWVLSIAVSGTHIYGGDGSHLVYSEDSGVSWNFLSLAAAGQEGAGWVYALVLKDSYIFAGGEVGGVFRITHSASGGFMIESNGQPDAVIYCLAVSGTNLFAGTENGVFISPDNGDHWTPVNNGLTTLDVRALAVNGSNLFAGTSAAGVFLSTNNGASWTPVNTGLSDKAVLSFAVSGNNLFAGTWQGGVFLSTNNGASWTAVNTGLTNSMLQPSSIVHSLAIIGAHLYAGTRGAGVWRRPLSASKVDFNGDWQEDILWRYYGSEGYIAVWYMGYSNGSGMEAVLQSPEGKGMQSGLRSAEGRDIQADPRNPVQQKIQPPSGVYDLLGGKKPPQVFRDPMEVGGPLKKGNRETVEMKIPAGEQVLMDPREIAGEGKMRVQSMNYLGQDLLGAVPNTSWRIVGTGDFNNDGSPDILWRYYGTEGYNVIWYMDGANYIGQDMLYSVTDANWKIVGTGDFDNNGHTDILWRHDGLGYNVIWYMDGANYIGQDMLYSVTDANWKIVGTGDFDNNGHTDILWRHAGLGYNVIWYMDGADYIGQDMIQAVANPYWEIAGTGDFNSDGRVDILWRYYGSEGYNVVWYMDGAKHIGQDMISAVADPNWRIENH